MDVNEPPLKPWMLAVLRVVAVYNVAAGAAMLVFYHEAYRLLGLEKPEVSLPLQLVGVMVALFGIGYWLVANSPVENRHLLLLGFLSKLSGSVLGCWWVARGQLPPVFLALLFVGDVVYLPPFAIMLRRLYRLARARG